MSPGICTVNIIKIDFKMQKMPFKIIKIYISTKEEQVRIMPWEHLIFEFENLLLLPHFMRMF